MKRAGDKRKLLSGYRDMLSMFRRYFKAYGGWGGFIRSPYLHLSMLLTLITAHVWTRPGWWDHTLSVSPSLLGFSLGGYAIWLAWGDEKFRSIVSGKRITQRSDGIWEAGLDDSPYIGVSATFVHYIVVQTAGLVCAIVASSLDFVPSDTFVVFRLIDRDTLAVLALVGSGLGYWLFLYSLTTALAAALGLFRVSTWYDQHNTNEKLKKRNQATNLSEPGS